IKNEKGIDNIASLIIAVMEVEAWFLADHSIFERINDRLSVDLINENLEIDIENDIIEDYHHPAVVLNSIYNLVGLQYKKKAKQIHSICHRVDYGRLCLDDTVHNKVPRLRELIEKLGEFE
ncbi:MAG: hypothetical protein DRI24_21385, partial [Deltaproteobacteria bacterium]